MAKPKVRIGKIDAANGSFTGVQIELDNGERITFQLTKTEGWVTGDVDIDVLLRGVVTLFQNVAHTARFHVHIMQRCAGHDWMDKALATRSMELMATKVMPDVNRAIGESNGADAARSAVKS